MQITKEQLQKIVDGAPSTTNKVGIIQGLYDRGVTVKGVDSYEAHKFLSQQRQAMAPKAPEEEEAEVDQNRGTGFTPSFESSPEDNVVKSTAKTIGNAPKSAFMLAKDIFTVATNPIETAKTVGNLVKGLGGKIGEVALEKTDFGQKLLEKMNEVRVNEGKQPLQRDASGKLQAQTTEEIEMVNQVGDYFKDRYGSWGNFKESAIEDPVGVLGDIASVVSGVGFATKQAGNISRISRLADAGSDIQRIGNAIEPISAAQRGTSAVVNTTKNSLPGRIVSEAAPTPGRFAEGEIVKALDLTQGDVQRISQSTGNDVAGFISRNNLLKETPEATASALETFKTNQYDLVRNEVAKVTDTYTKESVPRVKDALTAVKGIVDDVPGLEEASSEVNRLLAQDSYTLSDVQRTKEILDARTNIFTRSGDVKEAAKAQGLAEVRSELKKFIEDEVKRASNGKTDIEKLNNDVATARELMDAIELRETRGLTRNYSPLTSTLLGGAVFAGTGDIFTALGVAGLSKIAQTPSFRIAMARVLRSTPLQDLERWSDEIASKNLSPQTRQDLARVIEEARKNAQFIESGSQIVDEASAGTTQETP